MLNAAARATTTIILFLISWSFYFGLPLSNILYLELHLYVYLISSNPSKNLLHKNWPLGGQTFGLSRLRLDVVGIHDNLKFGACGTYPL